MLPATVSKLSLWNLKRSSQLITSCERSKKALKTKLNVYSKNFPDTCNRFCRQAFAAALHTKQQHTFGCIDAGLINKVTKDAFDPGSKEQEFKICAVQVKRVSGPKPLKPFIV